MIQKILITKTGKKFFVRDLDKDFHTQFGYVGALELKKAKSGSTLTTNTGKELLVLSPDFVDLYQKIARGPQIIAPKDIGTIVAETCIGRESFVIDAGGGSGALAFFIANIAKKVVTYELRKDFTELLEKNKKFLGLKNITIKNQDIYQGINEKNADVIILDLPEPWKAIPPASKALKSGGFLVSYSPTVPQASDFVEAVRKSEQFIVLKTKEILERKWEFSERKIRPYTKMLAHTGFLTFCRRV